MALPEVTYRDVMSRYMDGDASDLGEQQAVETLIGDVVDDVTVKYGSRVQSRLDAGIITERTFKRIVSSVVLRVARNSEGIYREQLGNYNYQMSQKVASGYVMYLPEELEALIGGRGLSVGTVDMRIASPGGGVAW